MPSLPAGPPREHPHDSPLFAAVQAGDADAVRRLIAEGGEHGQQAPLMRVLLAAGAKANRDAIVMTAGDDV
ncbi:MAG: hypothetical protein QOJ39_4066 [Candidatus Eremiobacteraeota bacterium]|jgi:hypothetical protein|nr:hypothetical protein [Candidatus Eremiobacteraeota bacterium]